eukprot:2747518-Rhodomonas_salina.1
MKDVRLNPTSLLHSLPQVFQIDARTRAVIDHRLRTSTAAVRQQVPYCPTHLVLISRMVLRSPGTNLAYMLQRRSRGTNLAYGATSAGVSA